MEKSQLLKLAYKKPTYVKGWRVTRHTRTSFVARKEGREVFFYIFSDTLCCHPVYRVSVEELFCEIN